MLRRSLFIALFLTCVIYANSATFADVIQKENEQDVVSDVNYVERAPAANTEIEPTSGIKRPAAFGIIALAIGIGGGMVVRRKAN